MNNLKRFTVCKLAGHKWLKISYPPSADGEATGTFLRCERCDKENGGCGKEDRMAHGQDPFRGDAITSGRWAGFQRHYPPAIAPTTMNGSCPSATAWGRGASAASCDRSSPHAKNRTKARRLSVP